MRHSTQLAGFAAIAILLCADRASATWSVVGVDPVTREVGVAGASCIGGIERIIGLVPDVGALAAQAALSDSVRDVAIGYLANGSSPQQVIDMTAASTTGFNSRQYGVVDLMLRTAVYTGTGASVEKAATAGMGVTAQGNLLTTTNVVSASLTAFAASPPPTFENTWSLADRLLVALEAGVPLGGDGRCHADRTALSASLRVAHPTDASSSPYIDLVVPMQPGNPTQSGPNPVTKLRQMYDQWRASNPRPPRPGGSGGADGGGGAAGTGGAPDGGGAAGGAGVGGSSGAGGGSSGAGGSGGAGASGGRAGASSGQTGGTGNVAGAGGSGGTGTDGAAGVATGSGAGSGVASRPGDDGGCSCALVGRSGWSPSWWAALAVAVLGRILARRSAARQRVPSAAKAHPTEYR